MYDLVGQLMWALKGNSFAEGHPYSMERVKMGGNVKNPHLFWLILNCPMVCARTIVRTRSVLSEVLLAGRTRPVASVMDGSIPVPPDWF